jgi:hypothetical protein
MVPDMLRGTLVVIAMAFIMLALAALIGYERQMDLLEKGAEGPYRKEALGRCVCK